MEIISSQLDSENKIYQVKINFNELIINKDEVELTLGYNKGKIPEHFSEIIDEVISQLPNKCQITAGYRIVNAKYFSDRGDGIFVENKFLKLDKIVTAQLKKSDEVAIFLCTIGPAMEEWTKKLNFEGDFTKAYIVDTVASVTVECAVDLLHDHIENQMIMRGLKITNRYSPGYCNWDVAEQHILFSFLPKNFCEISLTDSALMLPVKSVSGIIGIGKNVKYSKYSCDTCGVKDCTYRTYRLSLAKSKTLSQ
jgi:hypothetical protein